MKILRGKDLLNSQMWSVEWMCEGIRQEDSGHDKDQLADWVTRQEYANIRCDDMMIISCDKTGIYFSWLFYLCQLCHRHLIIPLTKLVSLLPVYEICEVIRRQDAEEMIGQHSISAHLSVLCWPLPPHDGHGHLSPCVMARTRLRYCVRQTSLL